MENRVCGQGICHACSAGAFHLPTGLGRHNVFLCNILNSCTCSWLRNRELAFVPDCFHQDTCRSYLSARVWGRLTCSFLGHLPHGALLQRHFLWGREGKYQTHSYGGVKRVEWHPCRGTWTENSLPTQRAIRFRTPLSWYPVIITICMCFPSAHGGWIGP